MKITVKLYIIDIKTYLMYILFLYHVYEWVIPGMYMVYSWYIQYMTYVIYLEYTKYIQGICQPYDHLCHMPWIDYEKTFMGLFRTSHVTQYALRMLGIL